MIRTTNINNLLIWTALNMFWDSSCSIFVFLCLEAFLSYIEKWMALYQDGRPVDTPLRWAEALEGSACSFTRLASHLTARSEVTKRKTHRNLSSIGILR